MNKINAQCEVCKVFSNPSRLKILLALRKKKMNVSELVKATELRQPVISQNLAFLKNKDLLSFERDGKFVKYSLKYPELMNAYDIMRSILRKTRGTK